MANATSTVGLWPGTLSAAWDYRHQRTGQPKWSLWLLIPSIVGSVLGTILVLILPTTYFDSIVPLLIFSAATLFAVQPYLSKQLSQRIDVEKRRSIDNPETKILLRAATLQFFIGMLRRVFWCRHWNTHARYARWPWPWRHPSPQWIQKTCLQWLLTRVPHLLSC